MNELLDKAAAMAPAVLLVAVCLNTLLSATSVILDKVKDVTLSDVDNKAVGVVNTAITLVQKLIDILSANQPHK